MTAIPPITPAPKARRGFAAMSPERQREIASKGGSAIPASKRSFSIDRNLAAMAGAKGGAATQDKNRG